MVIFIVWIAFIISQQKKKTWIGSKSKTFYNMIMLFEETKILEFNLYQKSDKVQFIIYADLECLIWKIDECKNNPENSSTAKVCKHILSGFLMSTISSFKTIQNTHDVYRGKDCIKEFWVRNEDNWFLKNKVVNKRAARIIWKCKICCICKAKLEKQYLKDINYCKVRDHCHLQENVEVLRITYVIQHMVYLKKFLQFFMMHLTKIIILSCTS